MSIQKTFLLWFKNLGKNWKKLSRSGAWLKVAQFGLVAVSTLLVLSFAWAAWTLRDLPNPENFNPDTISQSTKIWDRTGKVLLYDIHGEEKRTVISFNEMPEMLKKATLAAEDAEFYEHPAFDLKAMFRSIIVNPLLRGTSVQGGSTITQQLAKNVFLSSERTVSRKLKELVLAIRLEQKYSKDEILGFYLNQIPYGSNAYGIEAASQTFFSKPAKDLNLAEAALLAALPQRPSFFSPYGYHTEELKKRQEYVLNRMAKLGWLSQTEADRAKGEELKFAEQSHGIKAPHFVMYVRSLLDEMLGEDFVENGGLNVITSLNWELQEIAEKAVADGAARNDENWHADNAALLSQDPNTGEILTMVGSRDYFDLEHNGNFNVTLQVRQPGSSFKPFVYLKAFEKGYLPETILFDVFTEFSVNCNPDGTPQPGLSSASCYHPQNYDEKFRGPVTLRQALGSSLNLPSVKLLYLVGLKDTLSTANAFGIKTLTERPEYYGLSLILGGGGVKLIEMVNAYSVFAAEGVSHKQTAILKIADAQNEAVYEFKPEEERVFDANLVRVLTNVLADDSARSFTFQANGPLTISGYSVAAKTGTSQDYRDAWTFGYAPNLVAGVWVGNNDYSPMQRGGAGGMAAAPIWNDFMKQALAKTEKQSFNAPSPLTASKPALSGDYIINAPSGPQIHSILYWVDKDDPQGPEPANPFSEPQFNHWEYGVSAWAREKFPALTALTQITGSSAGSKVYFLEPADNYEINLQTALQVTARVEASFQPRVVEFFFNGTKMIELQPTEDNLYSVFFMPKNLRSENILQVKALDQNGTLIEAQKTIRGNP